MNFEKFRTQTAALWADLAPSQRLTLGVVTVAMVAALTMLSVRQDVQGYTSLSAGKAFSVEEAMHAESVLMAAGLDDFQQRGGQILVPSEELERYNAALIAGGGLPTNWAEEWESQTARLGQFAGSRQRSDGMEIARAKMVSTYLRKLPDIAQANVIWDVDERPGWQSTPVTKATVYLRPHPGREVTPQLAAAVRLAVANSKKHLVSENVVVMDMARGRALEAGGGGPFGDETLARVHSLTDMYRDRVRDALSYIPGVRVGVNVNIERLKDSLVRKQKINPKETVSVVGDSRRVSETVQRTAAVSEPGATANVGLDLQTGRGGGETRDMEDTTDSTVQTASFEVTESTLRGGLAESVTVSVSIPRDYYRTVALTRSPLRTKEDATEDEIDAVAQQVEQEITAAVEAKVLQIVPPAPADAPDLRTVVVDSIVVPDTSLSDAGVPLTVTVSDLFHTYGRSVGLLVLAVTALVLVSRSINRPMPELPSLSLPEPAPNEAETGEESTAESEFPNLFAPPENKKREHLQTVVRDNPELAASVLNGWIAAG